MQPDLDARASAYLELMRDGRSEEAFFGLIECAPAVVPLLIAALDQRENCGVRAEIVHCIWQHRRPEEVEFLARLLDDPQPAVWQEALDGLVTIGGPDAIGALRNARPRAAARTAWGAPIEWIDEALDQLGAPP